MSDYAKGDRVRFLGFGEPDPYGGLRVGTEGTVSIVDDKRWRPEQIKLPGEVYNLGGQETERLCGHGCADSRWSTRRVGGQPC
jgi:hypothetical protein